MSICVAPQVVAEPLSRARGGVCAHSAEKSADQSYHKHQKPKGNYHLYSGGIAAAEGADYPRRHGRAVFGVVKRNAGNAVVYDKGRKIRQEQVGYDLSRHHQR